MISQENKKTYSDANVHFCTFASLIIINLIFKEMKSTIFILLMFIMLSCNFEKKEAIQDNWCISKIDYGINEQTLDSLKLENIIALSLLKKDMEPTNIIFTKDSIKLFSKKEVLIESYYSVEKESKDTFLIIIDNKQSAIITKQTDGYSLKIVFATYFFKKCK